LTLKAIPLAQLQRLFVTPTQCLDETIHLTPDQHHYLTRVLRLEPDSQFIAIPGTGVWWLTQLKSNTKEAKILETLTSKTELSGTLTLLAAPSKGQGFDDVVRMTTELGVSRIIPLITQRTIMQPSSQRIERWQRIAQEAAEQAHRLVIPAISDPVSFSDALQWLQQPGQVNSPNLIGIIEPTTFPLLQLPSLATQHSAIVLIGPEGGWTIEEQEMAIAIGCQPFSLGQRVLRAVTAAVTSIGLLSAYFETQQRIRNDGS
jgi:16S rRNA (uracil1498-N3)-methyltransferase